jgi:hypothetical protein
MFQVPSLNFISVAPNLNFDDRHVRKSMVQKCGGFFCYDVRAKFNENSPVCSYVIKV